MVISMEDKGQLQLHSLMSHISRIQQTHGGYWRLCWPVKAHWVLLIWSISQKEKVRIQQRHAILNTQGYQPDVALGVHEDLNQELANSGVGVKYAHSLFLYIKFHWHTAMPHSFPY